MNNEEIENGLKVLLGVVDLPLIINFQSKKLALYTFDYEDDYEHVFCAEYRCVDNYPKLWGYSNVSSDDAKNKLAMKLNEVGVNYA